MIQEFVVKGNSEVWHNFTSEMTEEDEGDYVFNLKGKMKKTFVQVIVRKFTQKFSHYLKARKN